MYHWNVPPGRLVFIVFTLCITLFSITLNGESQSGWITKNRPVKIDEERFISHMQAEEPYYYITTTEDPVDESETTKGGLDLETTRKKVSQKLSSFGEWIPFPMKIPFYHFTTTEDPVDEAETTKGGLDLETTRKNVSQKFSSFGGTRGNLKNGTVSSPECVHTKEEAYCQRVLIIAILLVTCTIISSVFILCLLQYFHLRKYTFYFNDAILPHQGNSTCTTLNGVTVKEVAL